MATLVLFALTLLLIGGAFAIPISAHRGGRISDREGPVLGASVLAFGLGGMNLAAVAWFLVAGEVSGVTLLFALAPIAAGVLGLQVVRGHLAGARRRVSLVVAAGLTLAGIPGYFALLVALLASIVPAVLFLSGLIANPRALLKVLDPRN